MKKSIPYLVLLLTFFLISCTKEKPKVEYPKTATVDTIDDYFGINVPDPYR